MSAIVRLPVQVGTSSLGSLARAVAVLGPSVTLVVGAGLGFARGPSLAAVGLGALGALLLVYVVAEARRAWRTRASDALLGEDLAFEGGAHAGLRLAWSEIDGERTHAETVTDKRLSLAELVAHLLFAVFSALFANQLELAPEHDAPVRRLVLVTRDGRTFRLAEADLPAEQASLDALLGSIRGRLGLDAGQPRTVPGDVLGCATCGAPLAADDAPTVRCASCGHPSPVPEELRARIRAHRAVADAGRTTEAAVRGLLEQPGAGRVNAVLAAVALVCVPVWGLVAVPVLLVGVRNAGAFEIGWMLAGGSLAALGAFLLARAALTARRALRLLASSFGARAPVAPGQSSGCRRCGAPLPATEALVVGCAYCQAENVLGIDLRATVTPTVEHALSLADLLRARSREASSRRRGALVALVAALAAGGMGVISMSVAREHAAQRARCTAGDAEACLRVGADFDLGLAVAEDDVAALGWYARGCDLGEAEACDRAANALRWGVGVERDLARQKAYRARACALGWAEACANDD